MARILAIDYGRARTGVAMCDPMEVLASPLETCPGGQAVDRIAALVQAEDVALILVGMPLKMSGEKGAQAEEVDQFIGRLRAVVTIPVQAVDERLTSVEAKRRLREAGRSIRKDKGLVDRRAAAILLQQYLDTRHPPEAPTTF